MLLSIWDIGTIINGNISVLSNKLYTKMQFLIEIPRFRNQAWLLVWRNFGWTQNISTSGFFLLSLIHRVPRSEKPISSTSETLSIFIYRGKFQMADFYQNVLYGENLKFPNVVILYTVGKKILYWTTFTIEIYPEN